MLGALESIGFGETQCLLPNSLNCIVDIKITSDKIECYTVTILPSDIKNSLCVEP